MIFQPSRALTNALILSLALHAAMLIGVVRVLPARIDGSPMAVSLVGRLRASAAGGGESRPSMTDAHIGEQTKTSTRIETTATTKAPLSSPMARAATSKAAKSMPEAGPKTPVVKAAPAVQSDVAKTATPSGSAASASGRGPVTEGQSTPSGGGSDSGSALPDSASTVSSAGASARRDGVNAGDLRQYRLALGASARRFKRYPTLAREQGWEGVVEVAFDFRPPAVEPVVTITKSCGKTILDEQALETLRQAARQTDLPEGLRGRNFRLLQEISFSLEDR